MSHHSNITDAVPALLQLIAERHSFLITSHARPDGDAIGSALGMMHLLEGLGKRVDIAFADPIPVIYRTLPGVERIATTLPETAPDAVIFLECDRLERTGFTAAQFAALGSPCTVNIDHHLSGRAFADFNWIDPQCAAVGGLVYDLAVASGADITPAMATCLYTAVLTDTGSFTYPGTVASTFALAKYLVERGADANRIAQSVYFSNPAAKIQLLGIALRNLHIEMPIAWAWVTLDEMSEAEASVEDSEGIVNYLIGIAGVEAAVFLRELPGGEFRLSVRSKSHCDVSQIAEAFGGGGHRSASGCTLPGPLENATDRILTQLRTCVTGGRAPKLC
ncbi:MAG: bifunctional oligoribonuclease/PAP phosphatase NrnA [Acidobacteriaceae bacterium]